VRHHRPQRTGNGLAKYKGRVTGPILTPSSGATLVAWTAGDRPGGWRESGSEPEGNVENHYA